MSKRPSVKDFLTASAEDDFSAPPVRRASILDNATERMGWATEDLRDPGALEAVRTLAKLIAAIRVTRRELGLPEKSTGECALMALASCGYGPDYIDEHTNRLLRLGGREPPDAPDTISRDIN